MKSSDDNQNDNNDVDLEWEEWKPTEISFRRHMFAGSIAGLAEHITMFPIDTIKTHLQCQRCGSSSPMQTWNCASRIVGSNGIFSLWRGVSAMFAGCIPAHAAYFGIFEMSKRYLEIDRDREHHPIKAAVCGAVAAVAHDVIMTPFDTIKQRMQLGQFRSIPHCAASLIRAEGPRALYLSFSTTLMMNIPYGCILVPINESAKKVLNPQDLQQRRLPSSLLAGCLAGGAAALLTTPLDVVKTRLQTQALPPDPPQLQPCGRYASSSSSINRGFSSSSVVPSPSVQGAVATARLVLQEAGWRGFLRGALPRLVVQAPAAAISWTTYDQLKGLLNTLDLL